MRNHTHFGDDGGVSFKTDGNMGTIIHTKLNLKATAQLAELQSPC